jgi:hypothetical protein
MSAAILDHRRNPVGVSNTPVESDDRRQSRGRVAINQTQQAFIQNDFIVVEGEQRYWLHVGIDRFTGQVIDKQIEVVNE